MGQSAGEPEFPSGCFLGENQIEGKAVVVGAVEDVENRVFTQFATIAPMWGGMWMTSRSGDGVVDNGVVVHNIPASVHG